MPKAEFERHDIFVTLFCDATFRGAFRVYVLRIERDTQKKFIVLRKRSFSLHVIHILFNF